MGGCCSTHKRNEKQQTKYKEKTQVSDDDWVPSNGIGRSVQKKQRPVTRIGSDNTKECQRDEDFADCHSSKRGSKDECWFDSQLWLNSDSDDDFKSVNGDSLPRMSNNSSSPRPTFVALKDRMQSHMADKTVSEQQDDVTGSLSRRGLGEHFVPVPHPEQGLSLENGRQHAGMEKGVEQQENSSPTSCLPRLLPSLSFNDKKAPISPGVHKARNSLLRISFKRRSNDFLENSDPFVSNIMVERPVAGTQVPFCCTDKLTEGTWSIVTPSTFRLRGSSYLRDKIKIFASEYAMYEPFGVDLFLSPKKISHIARYVDLPQSGKVGDLPLFLILNIQIPLYPAAIFLNETDGEGVSLVLYHKLSDKHMKVPPYFQEMFMKVLNDESERVRGFTGDSVIPFRERLKVLGRVMNPEELHLSVAERKVVHTYNEKPVLSRPQHSFYQGENYFEVDLDVHRFSYLARKGVDSFRERLKSCILDFGLTIQGNKGDELPEHVLCCARINKLDFTTCKRLAVTSFSPAHSGKQKEKESALARV